MRRWSLLLLLGAASFPLHAENLLDVYRLAKTRDAVYGAAQAAYRAGLEKLPQGRALLLPSIGLSANTTYNEMDNRYDGYSYFNNGRMSYNSNGYTLSLTQPVYRKQNFAQYQEAKLQVVQAEAQLAAAKQDLMVRVAQAYFDVLLARDNVALAAAQKKAIAEQLAQAKRRFEVGTATIVDTNEAQSRYDLTASQQISAENDLEVKRRALQQIINQMPGRLAAVSEKLPLTLPEPDDMDKWVATAEQQNPQIEVQRAAWEIAGREVERNRGGHYPTLDLVASYSDNNTSGGTYGAVESTNKAIGLQLNLPLYQGGAVSSRVREAVANREKARQDLDNARRQADLQTRQAFLGVTSGAAQVRALQQALVSSRTSLDSTKLGFEVGVRTNVDVLNAQQQLYSAKRDLLQARYNFIMSQLKLKAAVGTLREADLEQVNRWLVAGPVNAN